MTDPQHNAATPAAEAVAQAERMGELLGGSDARLWRIFDLVPHMIFVKDRRGVLLMANRAVAEAYGLSVEQVVGRNHADLHPDAAEVQKMLALDQAVLASGKARVIEQQMFHDVYGSVRIQQMTKIPFTMPGSDELAVLGVGVDVTEQREAERELKKAHDELGHRVRRRTIERDKFWAMSPDLLCISGIDGRFRRVNPAWTKTLGYTAEEMVSRPYIDFVHPDDRESTAVESAKLAEGNYSTIAFANRYRAKDGSYRWLVWNAVTLPERKLIYAIARDVTDRRAAEERFSTLVSNIPGAVYRCACDEDWTMEYLSDAVESITGYPASELINNATRSFASIIHREDVQRVDEVVNEAVRQRRPYDLEYRVMHRDGSIRWVYEKGQGVFGDRDEVLWLDGAIFDITPQRRAQQALAERTRELARSNADLEEFAYAASHDLRAPLRAIANLSEWIEEDLGGRVSGESKHHLELLRNRVQRMQQLIDDLLTYSRATRTTHPSETIDTAKLIEDVVFLLNATDFEVEIVRPMPTLATGRPALEQVFSNLIANAVKHHDRASGHIEVRCIERGERVEFIVADDGPGIEPEFYERVFKMFQTLRSRDEVEGSGMGLALVKKLVERCGGRVWIEPNEPRGCQMHFTWPHDRCPNDSGGEGPG